MGLIRQTEAESASPRWWHTPGETEGQNASKLMGGYPNNFSVYSGLRTATFVMLRGSAGIYWSSTAGNSSNDTSYSFASYLGKEFVMPVTESAKINGLPIRCLAN